MSHQTLLCIIALSIGSIYGVELQRPGNAEQLIEGCMEGGVCRVWVDEQGNCRLQESELVQSKCLELIPRDVYLRLPRTAPNQGREPYEYSNFPQASWRNSNGYGRPPGSFRMARPGNGGITGMHRQESVVQGPLNVFGRPPGFNSRGRSRVWGGGSPPGTGVFGRSPGSFGEKVQTLVSRYGHDGALPPGVKNALQGMSRLRLFRRRQYRK